MKLALFHLSMRVTIPLLTGEMVVQAEERRNEPGSNSQPSVEIVGRPDRLRREDLQAQMLKMALQTYIDKNGNILPTSWKQMEERLSSETEGAGAEWGDVKREYLLVSPVEGTIQLEGGGVTEVTIIAVGKVSRMRSPREKPGRYVIWRALKGNLIATWFSNEEFDTFSGMKTLDQASAEQNSGGSDLGKDLQFSHSLVNRSPAFTRESDQNRAGVRERSVGLNGRTLIISLLASFVVVSVFCLRRMFRK